MEVRVVRTSSVIVDQRLWLTADGSRLVKEGDAEASRLFCIPGQEIPMRDAQRFGLVEAEEPAAPEIKESAPAETKESKPQETKGRIMPSESRRAK